MESKVKEIFPLMERVAFIEAAMMARGWDKSKLTKESGASSAAVTRFFQDGMVSSLNTLKILSALGLIKTDTPSCSVGCGQEIKKLCRKVKKVIESETDYSGALESNIHAFDKAVEAFHYSIEKEKSEAKDRLEMNERIKELEKAMQAGRNTDTDAVASSNIGKQGT